MDDIEIIDIGIVANSVVNIDGMVVVANEWDNGDPGKDGIIGVDGKSAYDLAVESGYVGTKAQWLASLVGPQGIPGILPVYI